MSDNENMEDFRRYEISKTRKDKQNKVLDKDINCDIHNCNYNICCASYR